MLPREIDQATNLEETMPDELTARQHARWLTNGVRGRDSLTDRERELLWRLGDAALALAEVAPKRGRR